MSCVNFASSFAEGDERRHARDAASRWDVPLLERQALEGDLDFSTLAAMEQPVEPMLYGLDFVIEQAMKEAAVEARAEAIFTGQAGDAVFFQMPTRLVAVDQMLASGGRAMFSEAAFDACRRTQCSIWRLWAEMLRHRWRPPPHLSERFDQSLLGPAAAAALSSGSPVHPWTAGTERLPPGKRLQIEFLCNCQIFYGPTFRGAAFELVHPLLSQPVIEGCLSIPSYRLSRGTQDRWLARRAFRDLLPASIATRRGKGEASNYYVRAVVENLPFLRPFLLDGVLVAHGLLNRAAVDALLTEPTLMYSDNARLPVVYASFEAWARHWGL